MPYSCPRDPVWIAVWALLRGRRAGRWVESFHSDGSGRPTCDTPGCGREIPKGGEGHPEICPTCLTALARDDRVKAEAVSEYRARLLQIAAKALKHRRKAETDGGACIAYHFCANEYLDALLAEILPPGRLPPLVET